MLSGKSILIVEQNAFLALDFAMAVERLNGNVLGPVASVVEALALIDELAVSGAVVDGAPDGQNVAPLIGALVSRGVPVIVQTEEDIPAALAVDHPDLPMVRKPLQPAAALGLLAEMMRTCEQPSKADNDLD